MPCRRQLFGGDRKLAARDVDFSLARGDFGGVGRPRVPFLAPCLVVRRLHLFQEQDLGALGVGARGEARVADNVGELVEVALGAGEAVAAQVRQADQELAVGVVGAGQLVGGVLRRASRTVRRAGVLPDIVNDDLGPVLGQLAIFVLQAVALREDGVGRAIVLKLHDRVFARLRAGQRRLDRRRGVAAVGVDALAAEHGFFQLDAADF